MQFQSIHETMKKFILLVILASLLQLQSNADEGMWIPALIEKLNIDDMHRMGLRLTAEEIYSVNQSSIKDAIVIFGRGCTGEIISEQGLLLTNHHCGYGAIQSVSTVENDYLKHGFWSKSFTDEIPIPGLTVQFLIRMDDVTAKVLDGITGDMTEKERNKAIREQIQKIEKTASEDTHYNAIVKEYFGGNTYYLLIYETFRDVRLAGAPPQSIGKFGADTDNWMWPRHTGDFSLFRVYAGQDNKPADYSQDNKPYTPRHYLPIAVDGVQNGDFAMILGNPGSTNRYLTSWGVESIIHESHPVRISIRAEKLRIMDEHMKANDKVRLQYASKYAGVSNYWKNFIGQVRGLKRMQVVDKKQQIEKDFTVRIETDPELMKKYGKALPLIHDAYEQMRPFNQVRWYMVEAVFSGSEILSIANRFTRLYELLNTKEQDQEAIQKETDRLLNTLDNTYKNFDAGLDQHMLARMMEMYYQEVQPGFQPDLLIKMAGKHKQDFDALAVSVFKKTMFGSPDKLRAFLRQPKAKTIADDPAYQLIRAFVDINKEVQQQLSEPMENLRKGSRLFIAGQMEMQPERKFYSDANFSLRLTYGSVQDYYPADAVHYNFYTTTEGILAKEDPTTWEFEVPERLKKIIERSDYGIYANNDGTMSVNFLTNHDITGGNSGSPVINARGELIGLAFDGNWEAMSGDMAFEPEVQRTINVDIRYVLLIIDKYAGATNLIDEMKLSRRQTKILREVAPIEDSRMMIR